VATVRSRQKRRVAGVARRQLWMEPERRLFLSAPLSGPRAQHFSSVVCGHSWLHRAVESDAYCGSVPPALPLALPGRAGRTCGACVRTRSPVGGVLPLLAPCRRKDGSWQEGLAVAAPRTGETVHGLPQPAQGKAESDLSSQPTHCFSPAGHTATGQSAGLSAWIRIALYRILLAQGQAGRERRATM
jgi:hypothetical protein